MTKRIPDDAVCVFKGVVFDVYQWPVKMYDGRITVFEGVKRDPSVFVLALDGDDLLYASQEQPFKGKFLSLFGGGADAGEELLAAAKRELMEEAGLESSEWTYLRHYPAKGRIEWSVHLFVAKNCRKVAEQSLDGGEKIEIERIKLDDFIDSLLGESRFYFQELRSEIYSAYNAEAAAKLKADIQSA